MESPGCFFFCYMNYYSFDFVVVYVLVSLLSEELNFNNSWSNKADRLDSDFQLCTLCKTQESYLREEEAQKVKLSLTKTKNILNILKYYKLLRS